MLRLPFGLSPHRNRIQSPYGDVYPRAVAAGIDLAVLFFVLNDLFHYITESIYSYVDPALVTQIRQETSAVKMMSLLWNSNFMGLWALNSLIQLIIIGILIVSMQVIWGTTLGKWLIGLKIVRAGTHAPVEKWRFIVRYFAYIVAALPLMIGIFWASFNKERRGWHDFIAGTVVLNTRPTGWYWNKLKRAYYRARGKLPASETPSADTPQNIA